MYTILKDLIDEYRNYGCVHLCAAEEERIDWVPLKKPRELIAWCRNDEALRTSGDLSARLSDEKKNYAVDEFEASYKISWRSGTLPYKI